MDKIYPWELINNSTRKTFPAREAADKYETNQYYLTADTGKANVSNNE